MIGNSSRTVSCNAKSDWGSECLAREEIENLVFIAYLPMIEASEREVQITHADFGHDCLCRDPLARLDAAKL